MNANSNDGTKAKQRGFGSMAPERQRAIASKGGKAAHAQGRAHEFTHEEASAAGRKGGEIVSQNRQHMAEIGRAGGIARGRRVRDRVTAEGSSGAPSGTQVTSAGAATAPADAKSTRA